MVQVIVLSIFDQYLVFSSWDAMEAQVIELCASLALGEK